MWSISKYSFILLLNSIACFGATLCANAANKPQDCDSTHSAIGLATEHEEVSTSIAPQTFDNEAEFLERLSQSDSVSGAKKQQGVVFNDSKQEAINRLLANRSVPLWAGASVSVNLAGALLNTFTSSGSYEAALRLNLRNKYFPIIELGIGESNQSSETTQLHYSTRAPFARLGLDYNIKGDKRSTNRVFFGLRYGFSSFNYDLSGTNVQDLHWKTEAPFHFHSINDNAHWGELVFGLETSLWKFIHLGWSVRYQLRIYEHNTEIGRAWFVPGFGQNADNSHFSGTFQLIFDLTLFKKIKVPTVPTQK